MKITPYFLCAAFFTALCLNAAAQDVAVFPQLGHSSEVYSVTFSPDGKRFFPVQEITP
jgi:WD40 repeat protein